MSEDILESFYEGVEFLLQCQNQDGGLPASKPGDISSKWTTAEAVELFSVCSFFPAKEMSALVRMTDYLLARQNQDGSYYWGTTKSVSTITTAAVISALASVQPILTSRGMPKRIRAAVNLGVNWLGSVQNRDGGWGIQPGSTFTLQVMSGLFQSAWAIRALASSGLNAANSSILANGAQYILQNRNPDNGWGPWPGKPSTPGNTALALTTLLRTGIISPDTGFVRKGAELVLRARASGSVWGLEHIYVEIGVPPVRTPLFLNCPHLATQLLLRLGFAGPQVNECVQWFLETQSRTGCWFLASPVAQDQGCQTWTTVEALDVLYCAYETQRPRLVLSFAQRSASSRWRLGFVVMLLLLIIQSLYLVGYFNFLREWWGSLPEANKSRLVDVLVVSVLLSLVIGVLSNFLYDRLRRSR